MLPLIGLGIIIWAILVLGQNRMLPWLNKRIFSKIWCEEPRKQVARETIDRLKELMVDGDVPEETALLMVAKEQDIEAKDILQSFDADDAKELIQLLSAKNPSFTTYMFKRMRDLPKKNMRGSV